MIIKKKIPRLISESTLKKRKIIEKKISAE